MCLFIHSHCIQAAVILKKQKPPCKQLLIHQAKHLIIEYTLLYSTMFIANSIKNVKNKQTKKQLEQQQQQNNSLIY